MAGNAEAFPADVLVYVGQRADGGRFVVRPGSNRRNRWYWGEPTTPLPAGGWAWTLKPLPPEGYYNLPQTLEFGGGGRWVEQAIVQLGYNEAGRGIVFVAEERDGATENALFFSNRGHIIDDAMLARLKWAPILPVRMGQFEN
jgi:hypothetical protein